MSKPDQVPDDKLDLYRQLVGTHPESELSYAYTQGLPPKESKQK